MFDELLDLYDDYVTHNKFADNLKKIRKEHNLSQEDLAESLGVSRQAISKWESGVAYPEMDKIISLCDKFNLNIDDLLHRDVKEVKGEEESKKKINDYINDFLKFITDTINLFSNMSFKSKIKCLFEQILIAIVLFLVSLLVSSILESVFNSILRILPDNIHYFINGILDSIIVIFCLISSILIMVHLFKTRYLDYYDKFKKEEKNKEEKDNSNENNIKEVKEEKKTKIAFTKKEDKIIIRDPKHSEYKFFNLLFKLIVYFFKFIMICIVLSLACVLVGLFTSLVISFLVYKTGAFFIGLLFLIVSSGIITIIIMLLMLNFIFNRKSNKKEIIWGFILSVILFGIGCGLVFNGSLNFEVNENYEPISKIVTKEYSMQNNLIPFPHSGMEIEYIESDINNIKIDYSVNKYCDISDNINDNQLMAWSRCTNITKMVKETLRYINKRQLVPINGDITKITIYASKNNINTLKNNRNKYYEEIKRHDEEINSYQREIDELSNENEKLIEKINELEAKLEDID